MEPWEVCACTFATVPKIQYRYEDLGNQLILKLRQQKNDTHRKTLLESWGLSMKGTKAKLIERVEEAMCTLFIFQMSVPA